MIKGSIACRGKGGSGAHPASYSIGSRVKAPGVDHALHLVLKLTISGATPPLVCAFWQFQYQFIIINIIIIISFMQGIYTYIPETNHYYYYYYYYYTTDICRHQQINMY
jgi:hypothetical protein